MSSSVHTLRCSSCGLEVSSEALFCPNCGTPKSHSSGGDPLVGSVVGGRYLILDRIGHGGSGTIYRAEHVTLRRRVAVKVLHDELSRDDLAIERFRREATTVGEIDNDHIVEIYDFGRLPDGRLYLAMELLGGETLEAALARTRRLPVDTVVDVIAQLGDALMEAHAMGYVHRDLRPRNVFLAHRRGRDDFVKLLDFGLAKLVAPEGEAASTSLGMTFGDPKYMSPEQARGDPVDRRADIYSLGCIAYEMLVGEPPFVGGQVFDILTRHVETTPPALEERRADVPQYLAAAVARMLAKQPQDRFVTVYRLTEALRQGAKTGATMTDELARRQETEPPPSVSRAMAKLAERAPEREQAAAPPRSDADADTAPMSDAGAGAASIPAIEAGADAAKIPAGAGGDAAAGERDPDADAVPVPVMDADADAVTAAGASASGSRRPSGKRNRASNLGISAAWYADGEALAGDDEVDERTRAKLERARSNRGQPTSEMYYEPRRDRRALIAGAVALGVVAVIVAILWAGGSRKRASAEATRGPVAAADAAPAAPAKPAAPAPAPGQAAAAPAAVAAAAPATADAAPAGGTASKAKAQPATNRNTAPAAGSASRQSAHRGDREHPLHARRGGTGGGGTAQRAHHVARTRARSAGSGADRTGHPTREVKSNVSADAAKADFFAKLGSRSLRDGDVGTAAADFNKARKLDPRNAEAIAGLGEIALNQGLTSDAVAHLVHAAHLAPRDPRVLTLLGDAYLASGKSARAARAYKHALKINPDNARARNGYNRAVGAN